MVRADNSLHPTWPQLTGCGGHVMLTLTGEGTLTSSVVSCCSMQQGSNVIFKSIFNETLPTVMMLRSTF